MNSLMKEFVSNEQRTFKLQIGHAIASSLAGFVAGLIVGLISAVLIYWAVSNSPENQLF